MWDGAHTRAPHVLYDMRLLLVLVEGGRGLLLLHAIRVVYVDHRVGERVSSLPEHRAALHAADEETNGRGTQGDASYFKKGRAGAGPKARVGGDHQKGRLAQRGARRASQPAARERVPAVGLGVGGNNSMNISASDEAS